MMEKSFLLRDANGRLAGYLLVGHGGMILKAERIAGEHGWLLLADDREQVRRIAVECDGREHEYLTEGEAARACLIDGTGETVLFDGLGPCAAFDGVQRTCLEEHRTPEANRMQDEETGNGKETDEMRALADPQRRWPPPPCMPLAEYREGRWRE